MKHRFFKIGLVIGIAVVFLGAGIVPSIGIDIKGMYDARGLRESESEPIQSEMIQEQFRSAPMFFTENKGQFPTEVLFQTSVSGTTVYLCKNKVVSVFTNIIDEQSERESTVLWSEQAQKSDRSPSRTKVTSVVTLFLGANEQSYTMGQGVLPHYNNYFIGNNPEEWYSNVPNYQEVVYKNIYRGIDLRYYFQGNILKYEYIVQPGGDPSQIMIRYEGVRNLEITPTGDLVIGTRFGEITEKSPVIFQQNKGVKHEIKGHYTLLEPKVFTFSIDEKFDPSIPLVIDPELVYSTYLGGTGDDRGWGIAVDGAGNAYVTGGTSSLDFPMLTLYDDTLNGSKDIFVSKLNPAEGGINSLKYSTYIGGSVGEVGWNIAVDKNGNAYVTGWTSSPDFPLMNPYNSTLKGNYDVFVVELSAEGNSLIYSTFFGGTDEEFGDGIAVDTNGIVYIAGVTQSLNFPTTANAYDDSYNGGNSDVFMSALDPSLGGVSSLLYSTYLGGTQQEQAEDLTVDITGNVYICGYTESSDFPMIDSYDDTFNGGRNDSYIVKFNVSTGGVNSLVYSTYLGGQSNDFAFGIAVSNLGTMYVTGYTTSTDFPMERPYWNTTNGIFADAFVTIFSADGKNLVYSTYLGGILSDVGYDIDVGNNMNAYVVGATQSPDFPTYQGNASFGGVYDAFVSILAPAQSGTESLIYSTYLGGTDDDHGFGGIAVDNNDNAYVAGYTSSSDFPVKNPFQSNYSGNYDAFMSKFSLIGLWVDISKPLRSLYINNIDIIQLMKEKFPLLSGIRWPFRPWIIGNITIEATAGDDISGIDRVEFYIDDEFNNSDSNAPYSWPWDPDATGLHTIKVIAFANDNRSMPQPIEVRVIMT